MMMKFPRYSLTEKQIRGLANIVAHEQGTMAGMCAEASLMANLTDIKGDDHATVSNLIKTATGGWFAYGQKRYDQGTTNKKAIRAVKAVLVYGKRTLPRYINEHDCISDIVKVTNNAKEFSKSDRKKYKQHTTVIKNRYDSKYVFYDFPGGADTGVDPFGYTSDSMRKKWGEDCYTLDQALDETFQAGEHYKGTYPALPDDSWGVKRKYFKIGDGMVTLKKYPEQIRRVQRLLKWAGFYPGDVDGKYWIATAAAVRRCQNYFDLDVNGCFGSKCLNKLKKMKR